MTDKQQIDGETTANGEKFFTTPLIIIFATVFIDLIGFGMVIPILPYYAYTEPFMATPLDIGFLFASYSLMQFFFSPMLGRLSDKYGRRPILFVSLVGSAVGYLTLGLANTLFLVFLGRIIGGISGGNISTAQAYIADVTSKENRAKGMGMFGAAFGLGFILGPAIAGILSKYGVNVPFFVAAAMSLANAIALYFVLPESIKPGAKAADTLRKSRILELFDSLRDRAFREINLIYFLLITAFSIMTYAFVLYTTFRFQYDAEKNGYLFAFVGVISILVQGMLFGRLVKMFGETMLIVVGCAVLVMSLFALPFIGPSYGGIGALLIGLAVMSIGNSLASPGLTSLASKSADEHDQGRTMGIMQSGASLARTLGPLLGGFLLNNALNTIDDSTIYRTFWAASLIMFIALVVALFFARSSTGHSIAN